MSGNPACPIPDRSRKPEDAMKRMLGARRIAVVGVSDNPARASHHIAQYLLSAGLEVIPVNPALKSVFGLRCFATLEEAPGGIGLVDVFRRAEHCPDVVRSAISIGSRGVWLQSGIVSPEAEQLAREAGIDFVQDRCLMVEMMHFGG